MRKFRFEDLEIRQDSISLTDHLLDIADEMERRKRYRFSEQLRGAVLSISNNIAEGSGSNSKKDFAKFLNYSRRSCFEIANMMFVIHRREHISEDDLDINLDKLDHLSRKISNFMKSLLKN